MSENKKKVRDRVPGMTKRDKRVEEKEVVPVNARETVQNPISEEPITERVPEIEEGAMQNPSQPTPCDVVTEEFGRLLVRYSESPPPGLRTVISMSCSPTETWGELVVRVVPREKARVISHSPSTEGPAVPASDQEHENKEGSTSDPYGKKRSA